MEQAYPHSQKEWKGPNGLNPHCSASRWLGAKILVVTVWSHSLVDTGQANMALPGFQDTAALQKSSIAWCQTLYDWAGKILATKGFPFSCHLQNLSCLFHLPWFEPCMLGKEWKPVNNYIIVWFTQLQGLLNYNYQYCLGLLVLEFFQANKGKEEGKERGTKEWREGQRNRRTEGKGKLQEMACHVAQWWSAFQTCSKL